MKCISCGEKLREGVKFCPYCGASQDDIALLVAQAREGREEAISQLYQRTYNAVYASIRAKARVDEDTVLDVIQDAYVKGFQNLHQLNNPAQFQAWIKTIAMNRLRDLLKRNRPTLFSELSPEEDAMPEEFVDERVEHLPEVVIDRQETARLVNEILDGLSDEQRTVVILYYYDEMSVKEIASVLECSENTVKSRLNYARKKIKVQVEDLERRGTKLYGLAPLPFLLLLLRNAENYGPGLYAPAASSGAAGAAAGGTSAPASTSSAAAASTSAAPASAAGGGALTTKIVAGTLAALLTVGGGVGAGVVISRRSTKPSSEAASSAPVEETAGQEVSSQEGSAPDAEVSFRQLYQPVLDEFADAELDEGHAQANQNRYRYVDRRTLEVYILDQDGYQFPFFLYAIHDVDGNGTAELLIGNTDDEFYEPGDEKSFESEALYWRQYEEGMGLVSVYTLVDNQVVNLLEEPESSLKPHDYSVHLLKDNTFYFMDYPADEWHQYRISQDGASLEEVEHERNQIVGKEDAFNNMLTRAELEDALPELDWARVANSVDSGEQQNEPAPEESAPAAQSPEELYAPVLDMFYYNALTNWENYDEEERGNYYDEPLRMSYISFVCYRYPEEFTSDHLGYYFDDLNGDGTPELIIGADDAYEDRSIVDLYTCRDGKLYHVLSTGERWDDFLNKDNTIAEISYGGTYLTRHLYAMERDATVLTTLESVEMGSTEGGRYANHFPNGDIGSTPAEAMTEEEAEAIYESWLDPKDYSLTHFSNYTPHSKTAVYEIDEEGNSIP